MACSDSQALLVNEDAPDLDFESFVRNQLLTIHEELTFLTSKLEVIAAALNVTGENSQWLVDNTKALFEAAQAMQRQGGLRSVIGMAKGMKGGD